MRDPFGSMQGFMDQFQRFVQDPAGIMRNCGINGNMSDPNRIIQELMNSGRMSQEQYNYLKRTASSIQNNPLFRSFLGGRR